MTALIQTAASSFALPSLSFSSILSWQQAYSNYRKFKSMSYDQLDDLGLTAADVANAKFSDFVGVPQR